MEYFKLYKHCNGQIPELHFRNPVIKYFHGFYQAKRHLAYLDRTGLMKSHCLDLQYRMGIYPSAFSSKPIF